MIAGRAVVCVSRPSGFTTLRLFILSVPARRQCGFVQVGGLREGSSAVSFSVMTVFYRCILVRQLFEHLYSPKQAARQTEDRLYTHGKEVHTAIKSQKCIKTNIKRSPERLTSRCEWHHIYDKTQI